MVELETEQRKRREPDVRVPAQARGTCVSGLVDGEVVVVVWVVCVHQHSTPL